MSTCIAQRSASSNVVLDRTRGCASRLVIISRRVYYILFPRTHLYTIVYLHALSAGMRFLFTSDQILCNHCIYIICIIIYVRATVSVYFPTIRRNPSSLHPGPKQSWFYISIFFFSKIHPTLLLGIIQQLDVSTTLQS